MKRIICFDTSVASTNKGDYIIMQSCRKELEYILKNNFVINFPTHTPIAHFYQDTKKTSGGRYSGNADLKFVCGTNLMNSNMLQPTPLWNINIFNCDMQKDCVCVGVGMGSKDIKPNLYTRLLYKKVLSKKYIHSTRDERTAEFLRSMGFKAINTGCATTWCLNNDYCKQIPSSKSNNVITTITDYKKDITLDKEMFKILLTNYNSVSVWVQGIEDYNYLKELEILDKVSIIPPSLESYEKALSEEDVEFVGTRLHAGIKALQMKKRAIIIGVDNRAKDMSDNIALTVINRLEIDEKLMETINSKIDMKLNIKYDNIVKWKKQFND